MDFDKFIGKWIIIENDYEVGTPPQSGSYEINVEEDNILRFDMDWIDDQGEQHTMHYFSQVDGQMHEYENKALADFVKSTLISAEVLETVSYKDNQEIAFASREVVRNGKEMIVKQSGFLPTGQKFTNTSKYSKE